MDVLIDVGTVGRGEVLLLVDLEQRRIDEARAGGNRSRVDAEQEVDLFLDRHRHRVLDDRRGPGHFADARGRCQLDRLGSQFRIGLGDLHGLACRLRHGIGTEVARGREAPGAVRDHADADTGRFGVDDVLHLVFAGDHELAQVTPDAHVAVSRAVAPGRRHRGIGQALLQTHVELADQFFGGDGAAPGRNRQGAETKSAGLDEVTSLHRWLRCTCADPGNRSIVGQSGCRVM